MFHLIPIGGYRGNKSLHYAIAFLGQFLVVAALILLFVLYVAGLRIT